MQPPFCEYLHMLERVDLVPSESGWKTHLNPFSLTPVWRDVDRPESTSYGLPSLEIGQRMRDIILSGRAYSSAAVRRDVNHRTYVCARARFYACDLLNSLREIDEEDALWAQRLGQIGRPPPMSEWLVRPLL